MCLPYPFHRETVISEMILGGKMIVPVLKWAMVNSTNDHGKQCCKEKCQDIIMCMIVRPQIYSQQACTVQNNEITLKSLYLNKFLLCISIVNQTEHES